MEVKNKNIDIIDVKQAIKSGQLEVFVRYQQFNKNYVVYLKDKVTEEMVLLFEFGVS